jgi:hypothetical protein
VKEERVTAVEEYISKLLKSGYADEDRAAIQEYEHLPIVYALHSIARAILVLASVANHQGRMEKQNDSS